MRVCGAAGEVLTAYAFVAICEAHRMREVTNAGYLSYFILRKKTSLLTIDYTFISKFNIV